MDHKFVDSFSPLKHERALFIIQSLFNYYTVREAYGKEVARFIVHECKKSRNMDGRPQVRRYMIDYRDFDAEFDLFRRLINDATLELENKKVFLPNPSDMFEGENSFDIYRMGLL